MINIKKLLICQLCLLFSITAIAQEFISIWQNSMPNSKGLDLKDSIANERIYQVGTPGVYVFETSQAENKGAAVLIIPGGGYARLAYQVSGWQLAKWFNTIGMTAFVLNHRLPQSPDVITSYEAPLADAQRAMRYIRANAGKYGINTNKIGVMGCSAGGHLSATLSTFNEDWGLGNDNFDTLAFCPNFSILVSPVISLGEYAHKGSRENLLGKDAQQELIDQFSCHKRVNASTPPAFMVHADNDKSVSPMNSVLYYSALKENGIAGSTIHIFPEGGHNIALRNNPGSTQYWPSLAEAWLYEINILE